MSRETRRAVFVFAILAVLYLYGLSATGVLSTDEPRYAAIGREMARSGDWITPRLWGTAWFEKPPLLYWMTATATLAGLGPEMAPRLPVALLGFAFLIFLYILLREEFGEMEALFATSILGTSACWIAFSFTAVTDLPLAVLINAALLLSVKLARDPRRPVPLAIAAGALLGLAVLAKGLVPIVLFLPVAILLRQRVPLLAIIGATCLAVALPWFIVCSLRNGRVLFDELIVKHHFQRFTSGALAHVRPFWWFAPVLLAGLFPWTPLLVLLRVRMAIDSRIKFLVLWFLYGFLFFSVSLNKLPGYILPLMPAVAILTGIALAWARRTRLPLALAALLIGIVPMITAMLPQALAAGLSRTQLPRVEWWWLLAGLACAAVCLWLEFRTRRSDAVVLVALAFALITLRAKMTVLPVLDRSVSARAFYQRHAAWLDDVCLQDVPRDPAYGLAYYAGREFPVCADPAHKPKIIAIGNRLILLD